MVSWLPSGWVSGRRLAALGVHVRYHTPDHRGELPRRWFPGARSLCALWDLLSFDKSTISRLLDIEDSNRVGVFKVELIIKPASTHGTIRVLLFRAIQQSVFRTV